MEKVLITLAVIVGIVAVAVPFAIIVLVSVASHREESARSLSGAAPGPISRLARAVLSYRADRPQIPGSARRRPRAADVRFAHARRSLPDPGREPAGREPQPGTLGADQRESALV